ncbi:transposase [Rodentibacter abscessus]|uniref:transposase n=1 Tax=Rodentibacter abscessus TaxID=3381777 RepID=UPI00399D03F1
MLLCYLFGIKSEHQLERNRGECGLPPVFGMSLTEKVIDASTLNQNCLRRFNGTDVFEHIFTKIVWQAIEKGLVGGKHLFTEYSLESELQ